MADEHAIAHARYTLWEANRCGTPTEQAHAQAMLNKLVAEADADGQR